MKIKNDEACLIRIIFEFIYFLKKHEKYYFILQSKSAIMYLKKDKIHGDSMYKNGGVISCQIGKN